MKMRKKNKKNSKDRVRSSVPAVVPHPLPTASGPLFRRFFALFRMSIYIIHII